MLNSPNVEVRQAVRAQAQQYVAATHIPSVVEAIQKRAPNYVHRDGRIYASKEGEPYTAVSVSPFNPAFNTQIEAGVKPIVDALIAKNFMPISSCEGHKGSPLFVKVAFGDVVTALDFCRVLNEIPYVYAHVLSNPFFNVEQQINQTTGQVVFARKHQDDYIALREQTKEVNALYLRSHQRVWFVDFTLYNSPGWLLHPILTARMVVDRRKHLELRKQQILLAIGTMPPHY